MSKLIADASRLKPEIRLAQAVSQYEAELSGQQKSIFQTCRLQAHQYPPTPDDVMRLTAEIDRQALRKAGHRRCIGPRMTSFLQAVQQFAALGDIIIGGSQNIVACGVWSLVRFSLLSMVSYTSFLEKLSNLLMIASRSAPRYQSMALLYPRSRALQSHLTEYFLVVVNLCHRALKFTRKSSVAQLTTSLGDSEMRSFQSELEYWGSMIKDEVQLLTAKRIEEDALESSRFRILSTKSTESKAYQRSFVTRLKLLDTCSTYDYETSWKQARRLGHATLHHSSAEYDAWKEQSGSSSLIITGKLGSGKSVLLANIVDDLNMHVENREAKVAYFFCRHDIDESLNTRTVIGSLTRQLLRHVSDPAKIMSLSDSVMSAGFSLLPNFSQLLSNAFPADSKAYLVLDGLDELNQSEREDLFRFLGQMRQVMVIHLCFSIRQEPNSNLDSDAWKDAKIFTLPESNPDIETYIQSELEYSVECRKLVVSNPSLILSIQSALLDGAQGMFLWVALQIATLCMMRTDAEIVDALDDLPKDLPETFLRILKRSEPFGKRYQLRILQYMVSAKRPLTIEEIREALGVAPGTPVWDPTRLLNDMQQTLTCCGSLLILDEEDMTLRLTHPSVKQFLVSGAEGSVSIPFTVDCAETTMASTIITYLSYGIFGTQLSTTVRQPLNSDAVAPMIVRSTLDALPPIRSLTLRLLKSKKQPKYDIGKSLVQSAKSRSINDYHFLRYAEAYGSQHVGIMIGQDKVIDELFWKLLRDKRINWHGGVENDQTLLRLAITNEDLTGVKLLLGYTTVAINRVGEDGLSLVALAVSIGNYDVVDQLLETKSLESLPRMSSGKSPLSIATTLPDRAIANRIIRSPSAYLSFGNYLNQISLSIKAPDIPEPTKKWIISVLEDVFTQDDVPIKPALSWAIRNGSEGLVERLVSRSDLDLEDIKKEDSPLFPAVWGSHEGIVRILLQTGKVEINPRDVSQRTPLSVVAQTGHIEITKLLLTTNDIDIDPTDSSGHTPLSRAALQGHLGIMNLLLGTGKVDTSGLESVTWSLAAEPDPGHLEVLKWILTRGLFDVNTKDDIDGRTVLAMAAKAGNLGAVKMLLETGGAQVGARDVSGRVPLTYAVMEGHLETVQVLIAAGSPMDPDGLGFTPLDWARRRRHNEIEKILAEEIQVGLH